MIPIRHRFHGHNSLSLVYQKGQTSRTPQLTLKSVSNPRRKMYRVAVVVSRKVNKSAVVRNRIRRRIYEVVRTHEPLIPDSYDLAFTAFSDELARLPSPELEAVVVGLLQKLEPSGKTSADDPQAPERRRGIVKPKGL